jgi:ABC-2 type transport system ATP-binding protein
MSGINMSNNNFAIVCENLTKKYKGRAVVDALDLRVPRNTVFGFLGPNGAGKSTTIRLLTGQIKPTAGKAWVAGAEVGNGSLESHKHIGYLSELPNFYNWMKGYELLEWVGELFSMSPADRRTRARELLRLVGIEEAGGRKIGTYSGGMRQRLGIAQALMNRPEVVFLDEPVSALDPVGRRDVLTMLDNIRQESTVFMSSHVLADVDRVAEQVAIIHKGKLVTAGATIALKEQYARPALAIMLEGGEAAAEVLACALKQNPLVKLVTPQENGRLQVEMVNEAAVREAGQFIPRLIAEKGLTLLSFQAALPNLEDVFIELVGKLETEEAKRK